MKEGFYHNSILEKLSFEPTQDQSLAIKKIDNFLSQPNSQQGFMLKGYAGTGKTTLVAALVKVLKEKKMKVVLLAPTGRAAKVLGGYCKQPAFTIHKKIYFLQEIGGASKFVLGKNMHRNTLFVIDEASMISHDSGFTSGFETRNLLDDLFKYVYNGQNCKLMFVGDDAQLPPVGLDVSPALNPDYLERKYHIPFDLIELKNVVRQTSDSGILVNATEIRNQIGENNGFSLKLSTDFDDVQLVLGYDLQDELEQAVNKHGIENVLVVCRSNKRANIYNQQIRNRVLWFEEELASGDLMMVVKNNYFWIDEKSTQGFIANGDVLRIERINKYEDMYGFRFADVECVFPDSSDEIVSTKILLESIYVDGPSLPRDVMKILFYEVEKDYMDISSRKKRTELVMKSPYFNALQVKFAYAVTCHKSQGGQWDAVFVDQGYLTEDMLDKSLMRWMYTAITRAKEKLFLVNFHSDFLLEKEG